MKEQILKEFKRKFVVHCSDGDILDGMVDAKDVIKFLDKALAQTREETIRDEIKRKEEMIITKDNAEELVHTPLCKENPEKGNNHFFCNITNADYFRNQVILEDIKYLKELLNKLKK